MDAFDGFSFFFPPGDFKEKDMSDLESPDVETESSQREEPSGGIRPSNVTGVYASRYTGNAEAGGTHTAKLTVLHDPKGFRRPLFNWL